MAATVAVRVAAMGATMEEGVVVVMVAATAAEKAAENVVATKAAMAAATEVAMEVGMVAVRVVTSGCAHTSASDVGCAAVTVSRKSRLGE